VKRHVRTASEPIPDVVPDRVNLGWCAVATPLWPIVRASESGDGAHPY